MILRTATLTGIAPVRPATPAQEAEEGQPQIPTILTPTAGARLAAMNTLVCPGEDLVSRSSNVPGPEGPNELALMYRYPPGRNRGTQQLWPHHRSTIPILAQGSCGTGALYARHGGQLVWALRPQHPVRPPPRQPSHPHPDRPDIRSQGERRSPLTRTCWSEDLHQPDRTLWTSPT